MNVILRRVWSYFGIVLRHHRWREGLAAVIDIQRQADADLTKVAQAFDLVGLLLGPLLSGVLLVVHPLVHPLDELLRVLVLGLRRRGGGEHQQQQVTGHEVQRASEADRERRERDPFTPRDRAPSQAQRDRQ